MKAARLIAVAAVASLLGPIASCVPGGSPEADDERLPEVSQGDRDRFERVGLSTDFSSYSVDPALLLSGGPPKDGIPALSNPAYDSVDEADRDQADDTRGIFLEHEGEVRFYPFSILVWHEIVNDSIGDLDFAATF